MRSESMAFNVVCLIFSERLCIEGTKRKNLVSDPEARNHVPQGVFSFGLYCYFRHSHAANWSFHHISCLPLPLCFYISNETHDRRGTLTNSVQASRKAPHVTDSRSSYGTLYSQRCSSEWSKIIQKGDQWI